MEFQYDPKHRRHVEGWNIIYFDGEDRIGLTAEEYLYVGMDFSGNDMTKQAIKSFEKAISMGYVPAMTRLAKEYEYMGKMEDAYRWYLEAALADDTEAMWRLSYMYKNGIYVRKDKKRAGELRKLARKLSKGQITDQRS